jgi:hypothetical protein
MNRDDIIRMARVADEWPLEGYGLAATIRARGEV